MAAQSVRAGVRHVKPILSTDLGEARKRALNLYRAWYRHIPYLVLDFDIPKSVPQLRAKLREEFMKHQHVTDVRVIDMLVIKGQMELKEAAKCWKQKGHVMAYFKDTHEPKPTDFLSKFFAGHE